MIIGVFETCGVAWNICLNKTTGTVTHIDVEEYNDVGIVNSSLLQLGECLVAAKNHFDTQTVVSNELLAKKLESIDELSYNGNRSFWQSFTKYTIDFLEITSVTCDVTQSQPRY